MSVIVAQHHHVCQNDDFKGEFLPLHLPYVSKGDQSAVPHIQPQKTKHTALK
jgi:hypothetical protein